MKNTSPSTLICAFVIALLAAAGCLQLETHVKLHEDGSATVTERLQFSKALLDHAEKKGEANPLAAMLTKEAALERIGKMCKDAKLVSHAVREAERGARESLTVFTVPQITDLRYVSPFLGTPDYAKHAVITFKEAPVYTSTWDDHRAGWVEIQVSTGFSSGRAEDEAPPAPIDAQALRRLQPMFRDLLRGFALKVTVEGYAPIEVRHGPQRDRRTRTRYADLIDFSDRNLDKLGYDFLGNEEVMLELLRSKVNGPNLRDNLAGCAGDHTVPFFFFYSPRVDVMIQPSRYYFDKYFAGKTLNFGRGGSRPADFSEIGYVEKAGEKPDKERETEATGGR